MGNLKIARRCEMCGKKEVFNPRGRYCGSYKTKTGCSYENEKLRLKKVNKQWHARYKKYREFYLEKNPVKKRKIIK